jgi:hypothetical protein
MLNKQKEDYKMALINSIHQSYLSQYNISLSTEELIVYSRFVDRSIPPNLAATDQQELSWILQNMEIKISREYCDLYADWLYYLSSICFYNFFIEKKYPKTSFLKKCYHKGAIIYLKRVMHDCFNLN